ncbi:MAG: tRNA (guanosine(37)-N1)-methyltransferase TrmD [Microgenomates group bacterium]
MRIDILTIFPEMFKGPFGESIIKRAQTKGLVQINIHNLRKWAVDKRGTVDDRPYGGGTGMIMMIEPIDRALKELKSKAKSQKSKVILLDPRGEVFNQKMARKLAKEKHLIFICGHYEGIDERVREHLTDETISIGDYVLTGGELPAMVIVDAVVRLIPGVLEKPEAITTESFAIRNSQLDNSQLLEYPQYTRPENFKGWKVPKILLSGNHKKIAEWRKKKAEELTKKMRPDLL